MTKSLDSISDAEREWQAKIETRDTNDVCGTPIVTVCGPSGAGKSTVVRRLAEKYHVYIEPNIGNPFLTALLDGASDFDAMGNQEWFLNRVSEHVSKANSEYPLVLDQDPAAIVLVYARMFRDTGLVTDAQYCFLLKRLIDLEESLSRWAAPRAVLCLDAPAEILRQRVIKRAAEAQALPIEWFANVRGGFQKLFSRLPNATIVYTSESTPEQLAVRADRILRTV